MSDEKPRIIVDDDWKAQAQREKEQLASKTQQAREAPSANFAELLNLVVMQVYAAMGLLTAPGGERIPPQLDAARYFISLLETIEVKTRGNLTPEEKKLLEQVLYELRMNFVHLAGASAAAPTAEGEAGSSGDAPKIQTET